MTETEQNEEIVTNAQCMAEGDDNSKLTDNPFTNAKRPKKKKIKPIASAEQQANENVDGVTPTSPPSKRQKKREKRLQVSVRNKDKEVEKTIAYLTTWDTNHDQWKYEKLRQIYIQKNVFDEKAIPDEHCDVAIRYLATSKGHARQIIVEAAETTMKEIDEQISDENCDELTSSTKYRRARAILQSMPD